jgi:hypothetical protein
MAESNTMNDESCRLICPDSFHALRHTIHSIKYISTHEVNLHCTERSDPRTAAMGARNQHCPAPEVSYTVQWFCSWVVQRCNQMTTNYQTNQSGRPLLVATLSGKEVDDGLLELLQPPSKAGI